MVAAVCGLLAGAPVMTQAQTAEHVTINGLPDYSWYAGCFGTATGNLMGFWDRNGLADFYTGPTSGGVAPLTSGGSNSGIRSLWASKAGFDGRPADKPGHLDDYWEDFDFNSGVTFESTAPDPYVTANRTEHEPDCLGDFIGQSQNKWSDLNGECSGNINGYAFVFWDADGARRVNYQPTYNGAPIPDIPSGLKKWAQYRGYDAHVTSQLAEVNPLVTAGNGFTFEDLRAEIDAGFPVLLILQNPYELNRNLPGNPTANPSVHAMVAYGYIVDGGQQYVRYRTSWASGDDLSTTASEWNGQVWQANLPLRGVVTFRPHPRIVSMERADGMLTVSWHGPKAEVEDHANGVTHQPHRYIVERANDLGGEFAAVSEPTTELSASIAEASGARGFYRVRLLSPE